LLHPKHKRKIIHALKKRIFELKSEILEYKLADHNVDLIPSHEHLVQEYEIRLKNYVDA